MISYAFAFFVLSSTILEGHSLPSEANVTISEYCIQETEVTKEEVDSYVENPEKEPTEDYYCYLHCVFSSVGLIDENGVVQVDLFQTLFDGVMNQECLKKVPNIVECNDMKALDKCDNEK